MNKKILSGALAAMMLVSPTYAIEAAGGTGNVPVHLTQDATQFSVTVPTVLPVDVNAKGIVTVANDNKIINNSYGPVEVKSVSVQSLGDWKLVDFDTDFKSKKVGLHEYGFQMNNVNVQPDGSCAAEFEVIPGNGQISFVYDSKVATQNTALDKENIANVVFTIGWSDENATRPQLNATNKVNESKMDAALQNLTGKITFTTTAYQGEGGVDISVEQDGSIMAVVNGQDATVYSEGGALLESSNFYYEAGVFNSYKAKEMDLHGLDMSQVISAAGMFRNCTELIAIDLSGVDMNNTTSTDRMFSKCTALTSINLSGANMNKVTDAYSMFYDCPSLTNINLSGIDMDQVENINSMFCYCSSLVNLDLSNVKMSNVTNAGMLLYECPALKTVDLSGVNMSQVTDVSSMFSRCPSLTTINLSGLNMSKVKDAHSMFYGCTALTGLDLSEVNMSNVTDVSYMFYCCNSLTNLDLSGVNIGNAYTSMMFNDCYALKTCYAKTQDDCDNLNTSYNKPSNVNFIVKPTAA